MTRAKTPVKAVTLRMQSQIKEAADKAAELDHRNFTNFIESLVLQHCRAVGIDVSTIKPEEPV